MIPDNIPVGAKCIQFQAGNKKGVIYCWPKGGKWNWSALGNCGQEDTENQAVASARRWIRDS